MSIKEIKGMGIADLRNEGGLRVDSNESVHRATISWNFLSYIAKDCITFRI